MGGIQVILKFAPKLLAWRQRRMWLIWVEYVASVAWSYRKFHGRERRTTPKTVDTGQLAAQLGLNDEALRGWQGGRQLTAFHGQDGRLRDVQDGTKSPELPRK